MKRGFTLAEVLIVLGIIGIVAALTIPTLIANHKEKETVVKVKKVYSVLSQALTHAVAENESVDNWGATNNKMILDKLAPYLNIQKNCGVGSGCRPDDGYKFLSGGSSANPSDSMAKAILADGTIIYVYFMSSNCSLDMGSSADHCGWFYVDINGLKNPNQVGKDLFLFGLSKSKVIPVGTQDDSSYPFSTCRTTGVGWGCAAWVISNENLEYLKCNDLSWNGKTKCK